MRDDLKIAEIREKYDGNWVVVEVTKVDKYDNPLRGRVLFHNVDEAEVTRHGRKYREEHPKADLYYFFAGQAIPRGIYWFQLSISHQDFNSTVFSAWTSWANIASPLKRIPKHSFYAKFQKRSKA